MAFMLLYHHLSPISARIILIMARRIQRVIIVGLVTIVVLTLIFLQLTRPHIVNQHLDAIKSFRITRPATQTYLEPITATTDPSVSGVIIEPGNVQIEFTNPRNLQGTPKEIASNNGNTYTNLMKQEITEPKDFDIESIRAPPLQEDYPDRANATILVLVKNAEKIGITQTLRRFEARFNSKFGYPYTFVNDQPFSDAFKERIHQLTDAPCEFVVIPPELWERPKDIDIAAADAAMKELHNQNVAYAQKLSYHNMCRFYLGNFYRIPELQKYKWYWRIEPRVQFHTDVDYDVFKYLEGTGRIYGFTISIYDIERTIPLLWPDTMRWLNLGDNYKYVNANGAFQFLTENLQNPQKNEMTGFSTCHFWSNFEIADMDFFRGEAYDSWFKYLDSTGNFYYERWGDAPVHSIGVGLFANKSQIHWFRDIGYQHEPYTNCPNRAGEKMQCQVGRPAIWDGQEHENCMGLWINYGMENDPYL